MPQPTLLLIHGGWSGAWVWEQLTPELDARNIAWRAIDLPGCGARRRFGWTVSLNDYATAVLDAANNIDGPVVLTGHSSGGMSISQAAANAPERFEALIYLAAFLPKNGERLMHLTRKNLTPEFGSMPRPNVLTGHLTLSPERSRTPLYHDCPSHLIEDALPKHGPEPLRPGMTKVRLGPSFDAVPKHYVYCTNDRAITLDGQKWMADRYALASETSVETGHMPMFANPSGLADVLNGIVDTAAN